MVNWRDCELLVAAELGSKWIKPGRPRRPGLGVPIALMGARHPSRHTACCRSAVTGRAARRSQPLWSPRGPPQTAHKRATSLWQDDDHPEHLTTVRPPS